MKGEEEYMKSKPKKNKENSKGKLPENTVVLHGEEYIGRCTVALDQTKACLHRTRTRNVRSLPRELRTTCRRRCGKNGTGNKCNDGNPEKDISICV